MDFLSAVSIQRHPSRYITVISPAQHAKISPPPPLRTAGSVGSATPPDAPPLPPPQTTPSAWRGMRPRRQPARELRWRPLSLSSSSGTRATSWCLLMLTLLSLLSLHAPLQHHRHWGSWRCLCVSQALVAVVRSCCCCRRCVRLHASSIGEPAAAFLGGRTSAVSGHQRVSALRARGGSWQQQQREVAEAQARPAVLVLLLVHD